MFELPVGGFVVYPKQGVAEIEGVEARNIGDQSISFFRIRLLETDHHIWVPIDRVDRVGIRPIASRRVANDALDVFGEPPPSHRGVSWIRRHRRYEQALASGDLQEAAVVFRDMQLMKMNAPLSFGQLRLLEQARRLVVYEVAMALDRDPDVVEERIGQRVATLRPSAVSTAT